MLAVLTPKPFRGDVIAAGVVVLVTLVWTLLIRFDDVWGGGVHVAYCLVAFLFVGAMAVLAPMESDHPRAYQSVLYLATIALWIAVLTALVATADIDDGVALLRAIAACLATVAVLAFSFAMLNNSAACTLVGALASGIGLLVATAWVLDPDGISTYRYVLLFETAVLALAAVGQRDRHPRHGVALIDAAGLAVVAIAWSFGVGVGYVDSEPTDVAWGWELLVVAAGFGLIAYSSVDRQPGPAYIGVLNLILFTAITSGGVDGATFLGWPLALALAAAFLLIVGLRPTTPAPPPPDIDAPEPPPLPLR